MAKKTNTKICKYTKTEIKMLNIADYKNSDIGYTVLKNIAKGTTDPRVEFISQVLTHILIKFNLQNLHQASNSKS